MQTLRSLDIFLSHEFSLFRIVIEFCSILEFYKWHVFSGKTAGCRMGSNARLSHIYLIPNNL